MAKLAVHSIQGKGNLEEECVWLEVREDISDLAYYVITDTTFTNDGKISNELRHIYWFPQKPAKKGDWIRLMTKSGINSTSKNDKNSTTHTLYWQLGRTIWNKTGDVAVLFTLITWITTRA